MATKEKVKDTVKVSGGSSGAIYGIGVLGALIYFIQTATSFWDGVVGIIYAVLWPAVVVYKALDLLNL